MNPLYEEHEPRRVFDWGKGNTNKMDEKWENEYLPEFQEALAERVEAV